MKDINDLKVGFIGSGHMGSILINAINKKIIDDNIFIYDRSSEQLEKFSNTSFHILSSSSEVIDKCDVILLCVNPTSIKPVIGEILNSINSDKVLCSIAAGISLSDLNESLIANGIDNAFIRIMPNTPVIVGEGMILGARNNNVSQDKIDALFGVLEPCGRCQEVTEDTLEKAIAVFSCSPAYAFMFIDAIAQAGVKIGLDYDTSLKLASQAVKGSSQILLEKDDDIDSLVKSLCTKGGMTIEGVESLNSDKFYDIVSRAIIKASDKQRKLK